MWDKLNEGQQWAFMIMTYFIIFVLLLVVSNWNKPIHYETLAEKCLSIEYASRPICIAETKRIEAEAESVRNK